MGFKDHLLKHVVSHRRYVYMVLNNRIEELNLCIRVRVDSSDDVIYATLSVMKCLGCGEEGHIARVCPARGAAAGLAASAVSLVGGAVWP